MCTVSISGATEGMRSAGVVGHYRLSASVIQTHYEGQAILENKISV